MESRDYENILGALPDTGVYVIREEDRRILYFNKKVREVSPEVRLGDACHEIWTGSCNCCPLLTKSAYGSLPSRQDAQLWALSLCIQNTGEVSQSHSYCSLLRCPLPSTASAETQSSGPARVPGT